MPMSMPMAARIPIALTALRALLGPALVLLAFRFPDRGLLGACLVAGFVTDVLDGMVARRLGVATPGLRRLDSIADSVLYLGALVAAWRLHPAAVLDQLPALLVLGGLELGRMVLDLAKFGREASYHAWSAKLWGIFLFLGFFTLLALDRASWCFTLAIYAGIVADIEGLAISLLLREWRTDVPSFVHALRLRGRPYE